MAISILPPVALTPDEQADISILSALIVTLSTIIDKESAICSDSRQMTDAAIASLNTTLIDASDRIDATINPAAP